MNAVVKTGPGREGIYIKNMPDPQPSENEVKIAVNTAGICGTDLHIYDDEYDYTPPVILGHEFSGTVVDVGKNVVNFSAGNRVVSLTAVKTCGHCRYCREGYIMLCPERCSIGSGIHGAFAEYIVVPEHTVMEIPGNVSLEEATLFEPLSCVVRSVLETSRIKAGDTVLVSGPGTIGQLAAQIASISGSEVTVVGIGSDKERLKMAIDNGAVSTFISTDKDFYKNIRDRIGEYGFDLVFECAGAAASAETCLHLVRKRGQYVQVGLFGKTVPFDMDLALTKEVNIVSSFGTMKSSWERTMRLMEAKKINLEPLISEILPLREWKKGFYKAQSGHGFKIFIRG